MGVKGIGGATQGEDEVTEVPPAVTDANGGHTVKILRTVPLVRLDHADVKVKVKEVPPDFVFPEPPKPVLPPPITPTASEEASSTTTTLARASPFIPLLVCLDGSVFAVVAAAQWVRAIKARRRSFLLELSQLCAVADLALEEERSPVSARQRSGSSSSSGRLGSLGSSSGNLRDRAEEAEWQRAKLEELVATSLQLGKHETWEAVWRRGDESRRLESYARKLSQRLAKVERAAKELNVMAEIEQLLDRLVSGGAGVHGARDMSAGGSGSGALYDRSEIDDGDRGVIPQRDRLSTRAASLLSRRCSGRSDSGGNTTCLFREELTRWFDRLTVREQEAEDWLKLGLKTWDLDVTDKAIEQLRLLQRPETVHESQEKRDIVRHNRWEIQETLKKAVKLAKEGDPSRLRSACVKAETFSCEGLDEYQTAKQLLKETQVDQLEKEARSVLRKHGILPDARCNVRFDLANGPTLLLRDVPGEATVVDRGDGLFTSVDSGRTATPCVCRRNVLDSVKQEAGDHRSGAPHYGGVSAGQQPRGDRADEGCGRADEGVEGVEFCCCSRCQPTTPAAPAEEGSGGGDVATLPRPSGGAVAGGETMFSRQELLAVRRSAETEFMASVTKLQKEHKRACEKEASSLKAWDAEESYREAYIARLDERGVREEGKMAMAKKRIQDKEARRRREEENDKRRELEERQARDSGFWLALSMVEVCLAAAVAAYNKGLTHGVVLDAAWKVLVAECADGGAGDDVTLEGGTTGALEGYNAGGWWWKDAADGSESVLWWALSYAGSTAGAVVRAGHSSGGWLLEKTLSLVIPDVLCEARAVLSLVASLFSLALVSRIVGGLLGSGRAGAAALRWLLAAWVWVRFRGSVLRTVWELLLLLAPTPALVMAYGRLLEYVERHHKPDGRWWVRGWDVRPVWFKVLPFIISSALACFLGARAS